MCERAERRWDRDIDDFIQTRFILKGGGQELNVATILFYALKLH